MSAARRVALFTLCAGWLAGCALTNPRPVYRPQVAATGGEQTIVAGVERDPANYFTVDALARDFAFGLTRRGRAAVDLAGLAASEQAAGRAVPDAVVDRLRQGVFDGEIVAWLRTLSIRSLIFLEVKSFNQAWTVDGKRTRVALAAQGWDLVEGRRGWQAHATPEVVDEPGRGFQLATESALEALLRAVNGEPEPLLLPRVTVPPIQPIKVPW